ncbi:hypothetical protein [Haloarcula salinisoli]|uniref:Uncharacterized protein n=1 Tax=Haloarcula salinisoli TaxID=2487746 RepID=A0A8J7YJC5_9EURY|nr:hypothetical protein [Halomicroarcula salinisoli]MBX0302916.1 hypothetical protein [Halomicroarcula salinisoli]
MNDRNSFNSDGVSRRSLLNALGSGGLFAGMQSIFTDQTAAASNLENNQFGEEPSEEDWEFDAEDITQVMKDSLQDRFFDRIYGDLTDGYGATLDDFYNIYDDLSALLASVPTRVDALRWLNEHMETIQDVLGVDPDNGGDSGNNTISSTPVEIVGSRVANSKGGSSAVPSSAGSHNIWNQAINEATKHYENLTKGLEEVWSDLQDQIPNIDEYYDSDELADIIKSPFIAIEDAVNEFLDEISSVLNPIEDLLSTEPENIDSVLNDGFNVTAPFDVSDLNVFVQSFDEAVEDEIGSSSDSIEGYDGFSTSQAPSSESESEASQSYGDASEEGTSKTPYEDTVPFGDRKATLHRSELEVGYSGPSYPNVGTPSRPDICGELVDIDNSTWESSRQFAEDTTGVVLSEAVNGEYEGFGSYDADPIKPCPAAPGGYVRTVGVKISMSDVVKADEVKPTDPSTVLFFGQGNDGCLYGGADLSIGAGQYAEHLYSVLEAQITWSLYLHQQLWTNVLQSVSNTSEYLFCDNVEELPNTSQSLASPVRNVETNDSQRDMSAVEDTETTDSESDVPTVKDIKTNINTLYNTLDSSLDEIINRTENEFDFTDGMTGDLEDMIADTYSFSTTTDSDDAPDEFTFSYDSINSWRTFALGDDESDTQGQIDELKSELSSGDEPDTQEQIEESQTEPSGDAGSESIYTAFAVLHQNVVSDSDVNNDDIPGVLEIIGDSGDGLTQEPIDWGSVHIDFLCADAQELQQIVNFINEDIPDSREEDLVPDRVTQAIESDETLESIYDDANTLLSKIIRTHILTVAGQLCEKLVEYANMATYTRSKRARLLAKVTEFVRYIEGSAICGRFHCQNNNRNLYEPVTTPSDVIARWVRTVEGPDAEIEIPEITFPNILDVLKNSIEEAFWICTAFLVGLALGILAGSYPFVEGATGPGPAITAYAPAYALLAMMLTVSLSQSSLLDEGWADALPSPEL